MGSRLGSLAILLVIGGVVAVVAVLLITLDLLNPSAPDSPQMVVSLDEGELVLLDEPQSITVTIASGSPIATLELFVDGAPLVSILPAYSADRGAYIGTFVWTPERLGFADLRIAALDDQGVESDRQIRVEVTDDRARVEAAIDIQVLGITPLQQFVTGTAVLIAAYASGSEPIASIEFIIDGRSVTTSAPTLQEGGRYAAAIEWTGGQVGEVDVTITAVDESGRQETVSIPVVLLPADGSPAPAVQQQEEAPQPSQPVEAEPPAAAARAQITSPSDGQRFGLDDDLAFDVELTAPSIGPVASALLYLTPVAPDNTLGSSVLIHSSEDHPDGGYREVVEDVHRWIQGSGAYELQLVVFTPDDERYDDRITIHIVAVPEQPEQQAQQQAEEQQDELEEELEELEEEEEEETEIDLAIVTVRQAGDNRDRLNVTITNSSSVDVESAEVFLTVTNTASGDVLGDFVATVTIPAGDLRSLPLNLTLAEGATVNATVRLEAAVDRNEANNTFDTRLIGPDPQPAAPEPAPEPEQQAEPQPEPEPEAEPEPEPEPAAPEPQADLAFLDTQATSGGYLLFTVINHGAAAASFTILITDANGTTQETITRRAADSAPLAPGDTEILASTLPHRGAVTAAITLSGSTDADPSNNTVTLTLSD